MALGAALQAQAQANVPCAVAAAPASPPGAALAPATAPAQWQVFYVDPAYLENDSSLLGLDGSRVKVREQLPADPQIVDGRMQAAPPWPDRVDWSVYDRTENRLQPATLLYFDNDAQAKPHLCRIERRALTAEAEARLETLLGAGGGTRRERERRSRSSPGARTALQWTPADLSPTFVETFAYDERWRMVRSETMSRRDSSVGWELDASRCLSFDASGSVTALADRYRSNCAGNGNDELDTRYVHGADGRLLRSIARPARYDGGLGQLPLVRVYDSGGTVRATYVEDARGQRYRLPYASQLYALGSRDIIVVESALALSRLPMEVGAWSILGLPVVAPAEDTGSTLASFDDDKTLQSGKAGKNGRMQLQPAQWQSVWAAMHDDSLLVVRYQYPLHVVLAPAVAAPRWKSCLDPLLDTVDACP